MAANACAASILDPAVSFRNDTREFVFNRLLKDKGLVPGRDLTVETTGTPIEAIQLLLAGQLDAALVPEPAATAAIVRGKLAGKTIARAMDIQALLFALGCGR